MPEHDISDEDLLLTYYAGDDGALSVLMARHYDVTQRVARRRVSSDEDAEDVAMETWMDIAHSRYQQSTRWSRLKNGPVLRWLLSIVTNIAIDHVRREIAQKRGGESKDIEINALRKNSGEDFAEFYVGRSPNPMEIVTAAANVDDFRRALTDQEVVYLDLTVEFGYSNGETAEVLDVGDARATAIKKKIQQKWTAHCATQEARLLQQEER